MSVIFFATLIRSAFGFGESLVAVPLLALGIPLNIAVPLSVLVSITVAALVVVQDWKKIHLRSAGWLIFFTLLGIPIGLYFLIKLNERLVDAFLGSIIIAFSIYSVIGKKSFYLEVDNFAWLSGCGFLAGILGGAYGINGPPLVVYGTMRRWSPQYFRATLRIFSPGKFIWLCWLFSHRYNRTNYHSGLYIFIAGYPSSNLFRKVHQ